MAKRILDNLERDVVAAMRLGYGVHYGAYKADHPHTRDCSPIEEQSRPWRQRRTSAVRSAEKSF